MAQEEKEVVATEAPGSESTGTATKPRQKRKPEPKRKEPEQLPPWKVLLHNDDINTMDHVVGSIIELTPLKEKDAVLRTLEAHESGVALLLVTHKERAELFMDQFKSKGLTVSIEPAE